MQKKSAANLVLQSIVARALITAILWQLELHFMSPNIEPCDVGKYFDNFASYL